MSEKRNVQTLREILSQVHTPDYREAMFDGKRYNLGYLKLLLDHCMDSPAYFTNENKGIRFDSGTGDFALIRLDPKQGEK